MSSSANQSIHRCERCNRPLSDLTARYGWRCAEILGVSDDLNHYSDETYDLYMTAIFEANQFLDENEVDPTTIHSADFYESFIKMFIARNLESEEDYNAAYDAMINSLVAPHQISLASTDTKTLNDYLALNELQQWAKAMVPSLSYISPLQTDLTNVGISPDIKPKSLQSQLMDTLTNQRLLELDAHHFKGINPYYHINVNTNKTATSSQLQLAKALDHSEVDETLYRLLRNYDNVIQTSKTAGKALAAVGVILDVYELGSAVCMDLNDDDGQLGQTTVRTSVGIAGEWAGGAAGAKLGAMGGAALGTMILPGLGTVTGGFVGGLAGGIGGSYLGRETGEYVVDTAYTGGLS